MSTQFSRTLSLLRQEKNLSQRSVAAELKISQALLSHYENGVREPGLSFVVKACDYYGVSSDFLLGRTMSRDGTTIYADELHDAAQDKDNSLRGASVLAILHKKLLVNTVGVIFDVLGKTGSRELILQAYAYFSSAIYKLFRHIYMALGKKPEEFFSVPSASYSDAADADMKLCEMRFKMALCDKELLQKQPDGQPLSNDTLSRDYPLLVQSLLSVLHSAGERIGTSL